MAKQIINVGSTPNDGNGDSLRQGALKIINNFDEIYSALGDGNEITAAVGSANTAQYAGYAQTAGIATNAQKFNGQLPAFYLNYNNLDNLPAIPTNNNQLTNGAGYIDGNALSNTLVGTYTTFPDLVGFKTDGDLVGFITNIQAGANLEILEFPAGNFIITGTPTGLQNVIEDTNPQLGGNLDLNGNTINGSGNIDIAGNLDIDGKTDLDDLSVAGVATVTSGWLEVLSSGVPSVISNWNSSKHVQLSTGDNGGGINISDVNYFAINHQPYADRGTTNNLTERFRITTSGNVELAGNVTANKFIGDGSSLSGIATDVGLAGVEASVNALGTNLNIVGFYDATLGVVTSLTLVGQARGITIGSTLPSVGVQTGDYYIVSTGGQDVGIATYAKPGISSVYDGDWIVGIDTNAWSILSYSQQVVAPRATNADIARTLESDSSVNTSGIITAGTFDGSLAASNLTGPLPAIDGSALTDLTGAAAGSFGDSFSVPIIAVDSNGRITGITTAALDGAALGESPWLVGPSGISTTSSVGIGTTAITNTLTVKGDGLVDGAFQIGVDGATSASLNLTDNVSLDLASNHTTLSNAVLNGKVILKGSGGVEINNFTTNLRAAWFKSGVAYLYNEGNLKLQTTTGGVEVTGVVTATKFVGDGSGLIGVTASGTGIEVKDSGTVVGTAGTIDFGTGVDVSPASAGIVTITVNAGAADTATIVSTAATITDHLDLRDDNDDTKRIRIFHGRNVAFDDLQPITGDGALFNNNKGDIVFLNTDPENGQLVPLALREQSVGIGTTNPLQALDVRGNAIVSGILTATGGFSGSIDSATNLTGGIATASQLQVTGVTTNNGTIFAPASANLRFGNLPINNSVTRNIAIGDQVLQSMTGGAGRNIGVGEFSLKNVSSGAYNIGLGIRAGEKINTGSYNVVIGGFDGSNQDLGITGSSNNIVLSDGQGQIRYYSASDRRVGIDTTILSTEKVTVGGSLTATSFHGSASGLTDIPAEKITGVLPVIDGSNLINVTASGTGIVVKRNATQTLGVAGTFDFTSGSGIDATYGVGIATLSLNDNQNFTELNVSGVSTFSSGGTAVEIGLTTALTVPSGNILVGRNFNLGGTLIKAGEINLTGPNSTDLNSTYYSNIRLNRIGGNFRYDLEFHSNGYSSGDIGDFIFYRRGTSYQRFERMRLSGETGNLTVTGSGIFNGLDITGHSELDDVNVSGVITATSFSGSFVGSGAGLTSIPSSQLTGALPAIDGSNLIGVIASGTGIEIKDSDSVVGSAGTVNFGDGLTVSPVSAGVVTVTASGGSLQSRTIVSASTTSIADDAVGFTTAAGFKAYTLMKVGVSTAAWIRIYTDSTSRANDSSRSVGEDPSPGSGVIAEVVTTGISTQQMITPFAMGGNMDDPVSNVIYLAIKNLSGSTQTITANLTILQLEA